MEQNDTITSHSVTALGVFRGFMLTILTCLIIACNVVLFIALPRVNMVYDQTKIFMRSLAIADICTGVFLASPKIVSLSIGFWPYGNVTCIVYSMMKTTLVYAEQFSFVGITVDRFIAVTKPLRYHRIMTVNRCRGIVVAFWMTATLPVVYSTINRYVNDSFDTYYFPEEGACVLIFGRETIQTGRYIIGVFLLTIVPVLFVVGMSLRILQITYQHVRRIQRVQVQQVPSIRSTYSSAQNTQSSSQFNPYVIPNSQHQSSSIDSGQDSWVRSQANPIANPLANPRVNRDHLHQSRSDITNPNHQSSSTDSGQDSRARRQTYPQANPQDNLDPRRHQSRQELKVTFTILITTGLYVIAWMPLMVNSIANYFRDDEYASVFIWLLQDTLFFSNCFWNTIIYSFRLSAFRKVIKKILQCR